MKGINDLQKCHCHVKNRQLDVADTAASKTPK
jgi:hypothetical protein